MSALDLPFADAVLKPHYILSTGATALTTILLDYRHMYHDLACIINEAEDFYEVSHDIIIAKFDDSCKGNAVTFGDQLESLVAVDAYCLPKAKKRRKKRGEGMKEDRERYNCGASNKAILFEAMYDRDSPIHDEQSRPGKQIRRDYGVSWVVFINVCNAIERRFNPCSWMRKLKDVPFKLRIKACLRQLRLGGPLGQHYSNYSMDYNSFRNIFLDHFLKWMYAMKDEYIKLPRTEDEINQVEHLYPDVGHPSCIGSIECVHVGWNACKHTLKAQCTNAGAGDAKGKPSVVF
jgi:hypothetical protein